MSLISKKILSAKNRSLIRWCIYRIELYENKDICTIFKYFNTVYFKRLQIVLWISWMHSTWKCCRLRSVFVFERLRPERQFGHGRTFGKRRTCTSLMRWTWCHSLGGSTGLGCLAERGEELPLTCKCQSKYQS